MIHNASFRNALLLLALPISSCVAMERTGGTSPDTTQVALLAAVVALEGADMQLALQRGDTEVVRDSLDIAIERSLAQVALAHAQGIRDPDLMRQGQRAAVAAARYWRTNPPDFSITPPVADYLRDSCTATGGC